MNNNQNVVNNMWDNVVVDNLSIEDLDKESINALKTIALKNKKYTKKDLKISDKNLLINLNLINDNKLTRAAVILLSKDAYKYIKNAMIKIQIYDDDTLIFEEIIKDSIINIIFNIESFICKYQDINKYPYIALKESVINAFIHNDYNMETPITFMFNQNYLKITNNFYNFEINEKNIKNNKLSIIHNKLLVDVLFKIGLISCFGKGIRRIYNDCKKNGFESPKINIKDNSFQITLYQLEDNINNNEYIIKGIDEYLNYYGFIFNNDERIKTLVEKMIVKKTLTFHEVNVILKCDDKLLKYLLNIKLIKSIKNKYCLVNRHYLSI